MKRIVALLLCFIMVLCCAGCDDKSPETPETEDNTPIVIIPDYSTKSTVNGYKQFSNTTETKEDNDISGEYYANKSSKKFHLNSCSYAKSIKKENLYKTESRDELIGNGYEPCKKCNP